MQSNTNMLEGRRKMALLEKIQSKIKDDHVSASEKSQK